MTPIHMSDVDFGKMAQAAGYEEGCERNYGYVVGYRQCEICGEWGVAGEIVLVTDDGDLCELHLSAFKEYSS